MYVYVHTRHYEAERRDGTLYRKKAKRNRRIRRKAAEK
jgi:hypothetical protein